MRLGLLAALLLAMPTAVASTTCVATTHEGGRIPETPYDVQYEANWCSGPTGSTHHEVVTLRENATQAAVANMSYAHDRAGAGLVENLTVTYETASATARYEAPTAGACDVVLKYTTPRASGTITSGALPACVPSALLLP